MKTRGIAARRYLVTTGTPWRDERIQKVVPDLVLTASTLLEDYPQTREVLHDAGTASPRIVHGLEAAMGLAPARFHPERADRSIVHRMTAWAERKGLLTSTLQIGHRQWDLSRTELVDEGLRELGTLIGSAFGEAEEADAVLLDSAAWSYPQTRHLVGAPFPPGLYGWIRDRVDVLLEAYLRAGAAVPLLCNSWGPGDAPAFDSSDWSRWSGFKGESHWLSRESRRGTGWERLESFHRGLRAFVFNPPASCFGFLFDSGTYAQTRDADRARHLVASALCARAAQLAGHFRRVPVWWHGDQALDTGEPLDLTIFPRVEYVFEENFTSAKFERLPELMRETAEVRIQRGIRIQDEQLVPVRTVETRSFRGPVEVRDRVEVVEPLAHHVQRMLDAGEIQIR